MSLRLPLALSIVGTLLFGLATSCRAEGLPIVSWQGQTMGTVYTVKIVGETLPQPQIKALQAAVDQRLKELNRQMSHYQPDSELSQFNRAEAGVPFKVSPEFARVIRFSLDLCRRSEGAFDPTLAPVINLWGFGEKTSQRSVPADAELKAAMKKTGWQHLSVTANDELIKDIPDLTLNLGAVAKGFGSDEIARLIGGRGLTNIYVSIAGEVRVLGHNARGTKWQVGIAAPVEHWRENDPMAAGLALSNQAVSTSGDYQNFFHDAQGRRLCHIIDPKTGWPVQHNLAGVSVVAPEGMTADALATTLFVLGPEAGMRFVEGCENAAALFITRDPEGHYRQMPSSRFVGVTGYNP